MVFFRTLLILLSVLTLTSAQTYKNIPTDNQIQGRLNIINGKSAECVMHKFYTISGWVQIEGEIGCNGIDGLYYKKKGETVKEVLVSESKWNTSQLGRSGKNKAVKQMSQEWVLGTMDKLIKRNPSMPYGTLKRFVTANQYRARIFRLKPLGSNKIQIITYKVKNKGLKAFDEIMDTQLKPIDVNNPSNSFEIEMLQTYNECRGQFLHQYLSILSEKDISVLMEDNYIQKMDVLNILK